MSMWPFGKTDQEQPVPSQQGRVESGIPRLDYILKGGFLLGGAYTLLGPPGSGKTILGNQFCFNHVARTDGRCVYISLLVESHAKMLRHLSSLKFFDEATIPERLYYISGYSSLREGGTSALLDLVRQTLREREATLLVVDGMESIRQFTEGEQQVKEFVHELQSFTALLRCTTLLMCFK